MVLGADDANPEWDAVLDRFRSIGTDVLAQAGWPEDELLRHEIYLTALGQIAAGFQRVASTHPEHPDLWPFTSTGMKLFLNNPDTDYVVVPIDCDGEYVITGQRGSVHILDFSTGDGRFLAEGDVSGVGAAGAVFDADDALTLGADGSFEVRLGPARPADYTGDWWEIGPGSCYLMIRQTYYDWVNEMSPRLAIDRLDKPASRARRTMAELQHDLDKVATIARSHTLVSLQNRAMVSGDGRVNRVENVSLADFGYFGHLSQHYTHGEFHLTPSEALVIEARVPADARYWSAHLGDANCFTLDWMNRHTSVNGHTAEVDSDGIARIVISTEDPRSPNWLDAMGYSTGTISIRWFGCRPPDRYDCTVMPADGVLGHLQAESRAVSAEERDQEIRRRRRGVQLRKRW